MKFKNLFKRIYVVSDKKLDEIIDLIENEIRNEMLQEHSEIIQKLKDKNSKLEKTYYDVEKKYNSLVIEHDILLAKSKQNVPENGQYRNLAEEIFS